MEFLEMIYTTKQRPLEDSTYSALIQDMGKLGFRGKIDQKTHNLLAYLDYCIRSLYQVGELEGLTRNMESTNNRRRALNSELKWRRKYAENAFYGDPHV